MFGCTHCPVGQERCPRCASPLCGEHVPFRGEACAECELAYHEDKDRLHMNRWFLLGFALPWVAFAAAYDLLPSWSERSGGFRAITTGVPMLDVILVCTATAVFAGKGMVGLRAKLHRRSFIGQTPTVASAVVVRSAR